MEEWFLDWFKKPNPPSNRKAIAHLIGKSGIGKKTVVNNLLKEYNVGHININCLHNREHYSMNKRTFVQELKYLMSHQGIEYFLENRKKLIIIHNMHILRDKKFLDEIFDLVDIPGVITPILCIFNKNFISERLQSHISKKCECFFMDPLESSKLEGIIETRNKELKISLPDNILKSIIHSSDGNIHLLIMQWKDYIMSNKINTTNAIENEDEDESMNVIEKCFRILCNQSIHWDDKEDIIKVHGSLLKLLMSTHVCTGLDESKKSLKEKLKIGMDCMKHLSEGETLGQNSKDLITFLQWFYPTYKVPIVTIKTMSLPNFPSTTNLPITRLLPYPPEDILYIAHYYLKFFSRDTKKLGVPSDEEIKKYYPNFKKELAYELNTTHFKVFPNQDVTKKKINRFFKKK
tara:strand:+ start:310 stop:1524 length:1215 start_codon:yes stop_codon:yes gene_type:complete